MPKEMSQFWDRHPRPLDHIRVEVVDFAGGVPGGISLTLKRD